VKDYTTCPSSLAVVDHDAMQAQVWNESDDPEDYRVEVQADGSVKWAPLRASVPHASATLRAHRNSANLLWYL
jgi:hypothetical protein